MKFTAKISVHGEMVREFEVESESFSEAKKKALTQVEVKLTITSESGFDVSDTWR